MGAPVSKIEATEEKTAEQLLSAFKHMEATERRKHATVYNYWLSIRRDGNLPPIRDLDALEISDVAPSGVLLELNDGGEDADILHCGEKLKSDVQVKKVSEAPYPSVLSCIATKLGIIAISHDALAFEDHFVGPDGTTRCCVTLMPFSLAGENVDFVYGIVSVETGVTFAEDEPEPAAEDVAPVADIAAEPTAEASPSSEEPVAEIQPEAVVAPEPVAEQPIAEAEAPPHDIVEESETSPTEAEEEEPQAKPGFSKIFDALSGAKGFFGTVAPSEPEVAAEPEAVSEPDAALEPLPNPDAVPMPEPELTPLSEAEEEVAPVAEEVAEEPAPVDIEPESEPTQVIEEKVEAPVSTAEGTLQSKLTEVRSKADEARMARLRSEALMVEGLSAAYDFALDAEDAPEEYLKLVEAQGLKIQLRSPMKPVVKLAFDGYCDDSTIKELEAVLAWALKSDLPRGTLAERIEAEGGIGAIANGQKTRRSTDA